MQTIEHWRMLLNMTTDRNCHGTGFINHQYHHQCSHSHQYHHHFLGLTQTHHFRRCTQHFQNNGLCQERTCILNFFQWIKYIKISPLLCFSTGPWLSLSNKRQKKVLTGHCCIWTGVPCIRSDNDLLPRHFHQDSRGHHHKAMPGGDDTNRNYEADQQDGEFGDDCVMDTWWWWWWWSCCWCWWQWWCWQPGGHSSGDPCTSTPAPHRYRWCSSSKTSEEQSNELVLVRLVEF